MQVQGSKLRKGMMIYRVTFLYLFLGPLNGFQFQREAGTV